MPSNRIEVNGSLFFEVPDSRMEAIMDLLGPWPRPSKAGDDPDFFVSRDDDCIYLRDSRADVTIEMHLVPDQAWKIGLALLCVAVGRTPELASHQAISQDVETGVTQATISTPPTPTPTAGSAR